MLDFCQIYHGVELQSSEKRNCSSLRVSYVTAVTFKSLPACLCVSVMCVLFVPVLLVVFCVVFCSIMCLCCFYFTNLYLGRSFVWPSSCFPPHPVLCPTLCGLYSFNDDLLQGILAFLFSPSYYVATMMSLILLILVGIHFMYW